LYVAGRQPGPILEAGCFAHARRKFFELADVEGTARKKSRGEKAPVIYPITLEAVQKLDALFAIERDINGKNPAERLAAREERSAPLMAELQEWLNAQLARVSRNHDVAKAINYMLRRWMRSPGSSKMAGSASRTTLPNGRCVVSHWDASRGSSAALTEVASARRSPTR